MHCHQMTGLSRVPLQLGAQRSGFCGITSGGWSGEQRARGETLKCLGELARCFERELRPYDWSGQFVVDLGHRPRVADAIDSELRVAREHSSSALRALAFGCSTPLDAAPLLDALMPLLAGRVFTDQDSAGSQKVAIVNESFARHYFGDPQQALGHFVANGGGKGVKPDIVIVGVVKDAKHVSLREPVTRTVFFPYLQSPELHAMTFYVRTWQQPESAESTIRRAMQTLDANLVLDTFRTMDEQIDNNLTAERVIALLASGFGVLAALMAAVGLYGVLAYSTTQRTSEIGIRMALGATRGSVVRMVMFEVLWLAGISIAIALPVSLLLMSAVRSQLYGISSSDPLTLGLTIVVVTLVAIASAMLPARRASRVEPMKALRYE